MHFYLSFKYLLKNIKCQKLIKCSALQKYLTIFEMDVDFFFFFIGTTAVSAWVNWLLVFHHLDDFLVVQGEHNVCTRTVLTSKLDLCEPMVFRASSVLWNSFPSFVFLAEFNLPHFVACVLICGVYIHYGYINVFPPTPIE